jgi:cytochrome P450
MNQSFQQFDLDPCLPGHPDPYGTYAALLQQSAAHWCEGPQMWIVLGHAESLELMRDPRFSRQDHLDKLIARFGRNGHIYERQKLDIPYMDGKQHARMRQHVIKAYHGIDLLALAEFTRRFAVDRLSRIKGDEPFDLVALLANDLPGMVASELMGVPPSQQLEVANKVSAFVRARGLTQTEQTASGGGDALEIYGHYFLPLIQARRGGGQQDLLSRLIDDPTEGISLSDEQLLLIISSNFYSASVYTVRLLIGTIAWAMASHPDTYQRVRSDRKLVAAAIEEVLRWDPPAQALNASTATADLVIAGQTIKAGDSVTALVGAANRDPRVFDQPDQFLIDRSPNPHLSFAPGVHQCLGLHLARMQGAVVLSVLCDQFESLHWEPSESRRLIADRFRGFEHLILHR